LPALEAETDISRPARGKDGFRETAQGDAGIELVRYLLHPDLDCGFVNLLRLESVYLKSAGE